MNSRLAALAMGSICCCAIGGPSIVGNANAQTHGTSPQRVSARAPERLTRAVFVAGPNLIQGRYGHSATLLHDGRVLIAEGGTYDGAQLNTAELYDPVSNAFTEAGTSFFFRTYIREQAARLPDGRVLIAGGCGTPRDNPGPGGAHFYCNGLRGAETFNPASNTFSLVASMTDKRVWASATTLQNGKVLLAGGSTADPNDLRYVTVGELFDPRTNTFQATGNLAIGRISATATLLSDGRVLIAGGQDDDGDLSEAELFDPATGRFEPTGSMTSERMAHSATLLADGRVLMVGGLGATWGAELYDPATGTFAQTSSPPVIPFRYYHSAVRLDDGRVMILGGVVNAVYEPQVEIYDPATDSFAAAGDLIQAVQFETATVLGDGRVLKAGGEYIDTQFELPIETELDTPNPLMH